MCVPHTHAHLKVSEMERILDGHVCTAHRSTETPPESLLSPLMFTRTHNERAAVKERESCYFDSTHKVCWLYLLMSPLRVGAPAFSQLSIDPAPLKWARGAGDWIYCTFKHTWSRLEKPQKREPLQHSTLQEVWLSRRPTEKWFPSEVECVWTRSEVEIWGVRIGPEREINAT